MVTVIVGRKTEGSTCRVHTLAQGADEPTYTEFPSKGLSPGTPKWANYVKGVVDKFPGVYSVPTLYFVFVRCIQGRQCLILSMMAARKSAVTESPSASSESRPVHWYDLGIFCMPTFVTLKSKKYNPFLPQPPPPPTPEKQKENNNNKQTKNKTNKNHKLFNISRQTWCPSLCQSSKRLGRLVDWASLQNVFYSLYLWFTPQKHEYV